MYKPAATKASILTTWGSLLTKKAWFAFVASVILVYNTISLGAVTRAMGRGWVVVLNGLSA
jgi:hypothetical protein